MSRCVRAQAAALVLIVLAGGCANSQACRSCRPSPIPLRFRGMSAPAADCGCDGGPIVGPPIMPGPAMPIVPGPPVIVPGPAPLVTGQATPITSTPSK
ncbi:MAG: hypothetical protein U0800_05285 [Isosphaeraceae bacterium]